VNTHYPSPITALAVAIGASACFLVPATSSGGMQSAVFTVDYKPKFIASKAIPSLCDNPATTTEEPNYSPNYTNTSCRDYVTNRCPLGGGEVYVVVAHAGIEGVAAASFGVSYEGSAGSGIDPQYVTWTPCADGLSFPNNDGVHGDFPQPGGGLRITWNAPGSCANEVLGAEGVHAVVGVFYVYAYSDDVLRLIPNNNLQTGPEVSVADCTGVETRLNDIWGAQYTPFFLGKVGFGSQFGLNSCFTYPVSLTTWGKMKSMYKENQ